MSEFFSYLLFPNLRDYNIKIDVLRVCMNFFIVVFVLFCYFTVMSLKLSLKLTLKCVEKKNNKKIEKTELKK